MHILKDHFENNLESKGVILLRNGFYATYATITEQFCYHRNAVSKETCLKHTKKNRPGGFQPLAEANRETTGFYFWASIATRSRVLPSI